MKDGKKAQFFALPLLPLRFITFVSILNFVGSSEEDGGERGESPREASIFFRQEKKLSKVKLGGGGSKGLHPGKKRHSSERKEGKKNFFLSGEGRGPY